MSAGSSASASPIVSVWPLSSLQVSPNPSERIRPRTSRTPGIKCIVGHLTTMPKVMPESAKSGVANTMFGSHSRVVSHCERQHSTISTVQVYVAFDEHRNPMVRCKDPSLIPVTEEDLPPAGSFDDQFTAFQTPLRGQADFSPDLRASM